MSSDGRAQQLQAKMEREAALRSARMSHGSAAAAAARTATSAGGSDDINANQSVSAQSQRVVSPDERLAAKIAAEDVSAGASGTLSPTGTLGSISEASSSLPVESPEDRMAAKIRRETANSASTERSDAIQARTRAEQRRAEASYSAGSGSALGRSMPAATPGVTYVSARSSAATTAVVRESAADESTPEDRLQGKLQQSAAEKSTPEDRLQGKLQQSAAEESTPEDRLQGKLRGSCVAEESTPEDRLQGKLQQSAAEESTPGNRLQSKLRGESVREEGASFSPSSTMTPESRLVAKIQRDSTQTSGVAGAPAAGGSVGKSRPAAVGGVGAVAVRGSQAEEYEDGSRRSR